MIKNLHFLKFLIMGTIFGSYLSANAPVIDGVIEKDEWLNATEYELELEVSPARNAPALLKTFAKIKHDDENLYVAFRAFANKDEIRATIRSRDTGWTEDYVGIVIDTFGDDRYAIALGVNALGSQLDLKQTPGDRDEDTSWNILFFAETSFTDYGYSAEFKIPFAELRYPDEEVQEWSIGFVRKSFEPGTQTIFADFTVFAQDQCFFCATDEIYVIQDLEETNRNYIYPYITLNQKADRPVDNLKYQNPDYEIGVSGLLDLDENNTIEYTINPDFSQVEADVTQIDANSAFSLSYPEKRPFFNKGTDILKLNNPDLQPFYSRSINDPAFALKLLNQGKKSRLFYLSSLDNNSPYLIAGRDRSYFGEGKKSFVNVLRYQRLLNNGSKIGFLSTTRHYDGGGYGNLFAIDGLFQLTKNIRLSFDIIKNLNEEPVNNWIDSDDYFNDYSVRLDGEKFNGNGVFVGLSRTTENWHSYLGYKYIDPKYRADVGFAVKNDRKWLTYFQSYTSYRDEGFLRNISYSLKYDMLHNFDNQLDVISLDGRVEASFKGNTNIGITHDYDFVSYYLDKKYSNYGSTRISFSTSPIELISFDSNISFGKDVAYNDENPELGKEFNFRATLRLQLNNNLSINNLFSYSRLKEINTTYYYYKGLINRFDTKYQFSKFIGLRLAAEYNDFSKSIFFQPLFEWTPNPFTIFYVGGNQNLIKEQEYFTDRSQFFIKFQYLISL